MISFGSNLFQEEFESIKYKNDSLNLLLNLFASGNLTQQLVRPQNTMEKISIEILQLSSETIKFAITGCDASLVNALRRIMISEVPTLAPHLISIYENTSVLHDEFLCQRIGLIPFISDAVDDFQYPWACSCAEKAVEDCQTCKAYFILEAKNTSDEVMEVTSMHIRSVFDQIKSEDEEVRPVLPVQFYSSINKEEKVGIPIVKLAKNQEIRLRFEVQKGIGKMHAKWSPVSLAAFMPDPEIKVDETIELTNMQKKVIRDSCPTRVFEVHQGVFEVVNPDKCIYCGECKKAAEALDMMHLKNFLRIGKKKDRYIFKLQSIGSLSPIAIVKKSMAVLRQKLKEIEQGIN